jgi:general secretion pathway protein D
METMGRFLRAGILAGLLGVMPAGTVLFGQTTAPSDPATRAAIVTPSTQPAKFALNFKDAPLDSVLDYFSKTIGFEVLKDGPIDARVTMMSRQPVSADEALTMLTAALKVNGFTVLRDGQMLRIATMENAKKGDVPVHFGADPDDVADSDELITQVIPLQNVSATKLRDDLKPLIPTDADLSANEGSNTILITDISSRVKRIVKIVSEIDQHEATTSEIRIIQLKHANASDTAKLIDTIFKPPGQEAQQQQNPRFGPPQQQGQQPPQPTSERHGNTVVTAADDRTNTLLVMGSSETLKVVDDIIARIDADQPNPATTAQMRVYPLKFANAASTAKTINDVFKPQKSGPSLPFLIFDIEDTTPASKSPLSINAVADDRTNTVIVTGPVEQLPDVDKLVNQLDASPMSGSQLRAIHLKYADATVVAKMIQDMFVPKEEAPTPEPLDDYLFSPQPDQQKDRGAKIVINSDERTNILFVDAPPEWLDLIEQIAREVDSEDTTDDTLFIYHLRNSQAQHLEYTLNVLFGNIGGGNEPNQNPQQNPNSQQNNNGLQLANRGNSVTSNSTGNPGSPVNNSSNRNGSQNQSSLGGGNIARATNEFTGKVLVVAEPDTNSLLITTSRKYETQVRAIIAELDRPVPQVLIKCLIAEVTHDNSVDAGVDFSVLNIRPSGNGQEGSSTLGAAAAAASSAAPGGLVIRALETNLTATLQALAQTNKLDVLSRPYILTSDNQDADITVGDEVPFITESRLDENSNTINTIQYQDIGIILDVTPHINPDGLVVMDVDPQISSLTGESVPIQAGVNAPVFELRSSQSRVEIQDGQTIVIGGLMQDQRTNHVNKVPILGDLPLLGNLFRYTSDDKTKTELLIFLTPHVVMLPDLLQQQSEEEMQGLKLTPGAVEQGTMQDQLRGMSRGSTTTAPSEPLPIGTPPPQ